MAKVLKILTYPNEILRRESAEIPEKGITAKEMREFCADLLATMKKGDGVGLAAPQVGRNIRLVVVSTKNGPLFMFNPEIIKRSWRKEWDEEGCLSLPMIFGQVKRNHGVTCVFCDSEGQTAELKASGLLARVIQHETDHLDGVLFIDKAKDLKKIDKRDPDDDE